METNSMYLTGGAMVLEPELDLLGTHAKPLAKGLPEFFIWIRDFLEDTAHDVKENELVHIIFDR
jgi:hypothetical protein